MEIFKTLEKTVDHPGIGIYHATSAATVVDMVKANNCEIQHCSSHVSGSRSGAKFVGRFFKAAEEVIDAEQEVWKEGLDQIESMISELQRDLPPATSRRRRPTWLQDDGSDICLDRLRSGQDFWRDARRQTSRGQSTITIITDMATSAHVDSKNILWRGAAAVAMTHVLEEAGYRVELIAASPVQNLFSSTKNGEPLNACHAVTLKQPEQPVDLATLTNWVSGWWYRTGWFMWKTCHGTPCETYGRPMPISSDIINALTTDQNAWVISQVWSRAEALKVAKHYLSLLSAAAA